MLPTTCQQAAHVPFGVVTDASSGEGPLKLGARMPVFSSAGLGYSI